MKECTSKSVHTDSNSNITVVYAEGQNLNLLIKVSDEDYGSSGLWI